MKKIITSITLLCYLLVTSGFMMNTHYCMNRITSVHLFEKVAKTCGKCGMETHESDGCCRDEIKIIKLVQDQNKVPLIAFQVLQPQAPYIIPSEFITASVFNIDVTNHIYHHSPPLLSAQDTYLKDNVFRI